VHIFLEKAFNSSNILNKKVDVFIMDHMKESTGHVQNESSAQEWY